MPAIKFAALTTGLAPAVAPELLPDSGAQVATNCRLTSGDIEPLRGGELVYTGLLADTIRTLFHISDADGATWLTWSQEVSCVKGPVAAVSRYYYTGHNEPRATSYTLAVAGGGSTYPNTFRALGTPAPITAPTVSPSGGTGAAVSRYYCYTFYDDWDQESARSPLSTLVTGKVDDTWAISAMDAAPPNSGDITALTYVGTSVTVTTTNTHYNRAGDTITIAGVTTVANVNGTWELTAVNVASKTMTFTVSSTPTGTYNNTTDTTDTWTRVAPFGTCTKRLYRTSGTTAQFQLVAEGISATTYNDILLDGAIPGDELISTDWYMPPTDLDGLVLHPSGALIGFSGNLLCMSEPYQPHAWPTKYQMRTDYPIKALAVFGSNVAVATAGTPYTFYGSAPGQFAPMQHNAPHPCLSKRSMVGTITGAVYASAQGLVQISDAGAELITTNLYDRHQWAALLPALMFGAFVGGELFYACSPTDQPQQILVFGTAHTEVELPVTALYADVQDGLLYYVVANKVYRFDKSSSNYLTQDWMSKEVYLTEPRTLTAARVMYDTVVAAEQLAALQAEYDAAVAANTILLATGDVGGFLNDDYLNGQEVNGDNLTTVPVLGNTSAEVTFRLYADGALKHTTVVDGTGIFRLPSGYSALRYAVRVTSSSRIKAIELADNPLELKRV